MSASALVKGVVNRLRDALGDADGRHVFPSHDLRPPPGTSTFRAAPYVVTVGKCTSVRGDTKSGDCLDQVYSLSVCVTAWMGFSPQDRQAQDIFAVATDVTNPATGTAPNLWGQPAADTPVDDGMAEVAERIAVALNEDFATLTAANAMLGGYDATTNGFVEPFHQFSLGDVQEANGSWVGSDDKLAAGEVKTVTVVLSGARRIRVQGTY